MYKVLIAMATGGTIRSETVSSLFGAIDVLRQKDVALALSIQVGGYVARNRNELAKTAVEGEFTHLMFIDNDMIFPPHGIMRLIDHDKDIVGAPYNARGIPGQPVVSTIKMGDDFTSGNTVAHEMPKGLFKCSGMGTGFLLIKTPVFDKLKKPYFVAFEDPSGEHHTEDIEFCHKARKAGFDIWASPTISLGHVGTKVY